MSKLPAIQRLTKKSVYIFTRIGKKRTIFLFVSLGIIAIELSAIIGLKYLENKGTTDSPVISYIENLEGEPTTSESSMDNVGTTADTSTAQAMETVGTSSVGTTEKSSSLKTSTTAITTTVSTTTLPESPSAVVAFYADSQSDTDAEDVIHQRTVNNIFGSGANPVFHAGDVMEDGTLDSLNRFNSVTAALRASRIFYAALGNNDRKVGDPSTPSQLFLDNFAFPGNERWYSVNYGNLHLVVLDSAFAAGNPTQLSWLASDLQSSASQSRITGVMFHHPTFSSTISSQLINYGADFVISGHNHAYQHTTSGGIHYFVLSGQTSLGHMLMRVYSNRVTVTVFNNFNGVVDTTEFNER